MQLLQETSQVVTYMHRMPATQFPPVAAQAASPSTTDDADAPPECGPGPIRAPGQVWKGVDG